ncbi:MAG: signal recognition particle-docking protein FtsY [Alphaproteobacteria bacterium]|jgi:fused signal recognition particle receptor|nr:signal recognition particle-docking protein FtsY [Alphaproteobacteria bacterium]
MFRKLKLKAGLEKSTIKLSQNLKTAFLSKKVDEEMLEELEDSLIMSDVSFSVTEKLVGNLAKIKFGKEANEQEIKKFLANEIKTILEPIAKDLEIDESKSPFVILMIGVNGSGKTTSIGKIANKLKDKGKKVMLVAGDTFRAAAVEQLEEWGKRSDIPVIKKEIGSDAASLVYEAYETAKKEATDVLIIDTAGRLHNNSNLMSELEKIQRVLSKHNEELPHKTLLSIDATTGQNAIVQIEEFNKCINIDGILLNKLDGTAKGGVTITIADKFKNIPINYLGIGEQIDDLQSFNPDDFAEDLLGL